MNKKTLAISVSLLVLILAGFYIFQFNSGSTFNVKGRVAGFSADGQEIFIEHENIPGYMPAMTMQFKVKNSGPVDSLHIGDAIQFKLVVKGDSSFAEQIHEVADNEVAEHPAGNESAMKMATTSKSKILKKGDQLPSFTLTNQNNNEFSTDDFHGKDLLVTFIYTRCPLPNYCPLMSKNFKQLQGKVKNKFGDEVHLLSVSFDTDYDTPPKLKQYGINYGADFNTWSFATGTDDQIKDITSRFGVFTRVQGNQITHNLVTALINPSGKVVKIWHGNHWKPGDVVREISAL